MTGRDRPFEVLGSVPTKEDAMHVHRNKEGYHTNPCAGYVRRVTRDEIADCVG